MVVKECMAAEILHPDNAHLIAAYTIESAINGMPPISAKLSTYTQMESVGVLHCFGAYNKDTLVGFASVLISVLPHYNVPVAIMESIFVSTESRKTGAGIKLLRLVESYSANKGTKGLFVSAPVDGSLVKLMKHSRSKYSHTSQIFFKGFA